MNSLQPFTFEGTPVRTLTYEDGDIWFLAKDVCEVLGIRTDTIRLILDDDEVATVNPNSIGVAQNGGREPLIVSEPGLYGLIFKSRKPHAEEFKRWVKHEVLMPIRKHGVFMADEVIEQTLTDPDYLIRLATTLKQEKQARALAESRVRELAPKARALDDFMDLKGSYSVSEAAKILANSGVRLGPRGLFDLLCEMGWTYRKESHWMAKSDRILSGHLETKPYRSEGRRHDGTVVPFAPQVRVTRKGMTLLHRRLTEQQINNQLDELGKVA
ncbi:MAG: phage antirepressor KilAC domain-containing protein [Bifidobacterium psychraerophilum]|uniref:phage antirepressor n=1 Tax=Bifidobacterium psychraerophilum TaxID=218140 RepID=UPI0039E95156